MKTDTEITKVIFRKWKDTGDIIAIFPEIVANPNMYECESYEHIGQHGGCNIGHLMYRVTKPAKPDEYKDLLEELQSLGYNLKVYQRYTYAMWQTRLDDWKRLYKRQGMMK